jgi:hypothetical protein
MGEAYTPNLEVSEATIVRKKRILPIPGEVIVKIGEQVTSETVVAKAYMPGHVRIVDIQDILGIDASETLTVLLKKVGDRVKKGEIIASKSTWFGFRKQDLKSPTSGTIDYISIISGRLHIRGPPIMIDIKAYIPGKIVEILPKEGVVVEVQASFIQGIFGIGGETQGELTVVVDSPDEVLTDNMILSDHSGKIIVGGSLVTGKALQKASKEFVKGIIVGGIRDKDLIIYLGHEIGVAITGQEKINTTVILTEGFGKMRMMNRTFDLLKKNEGKETSINGTTQIRAGVIRPEIESVVSDAPMRLEPGTSVRCIHGPEFGALGQVVSLEKEPKKIETESEVMVIKVCLEDGREIYISRTNVEIMQH